MKDPCKTCKDKHQACTWNCKPLKEYFRYMDKIQTASLSDRELAERLRVVREYQHEGEYNSLGLATIEETSKRQRNDRMC